MTGPRPSMASRLFEVALDMPPERAADMLFLLDLKTHIEACEAIDSLTLPQLRAFANIAEGRPGHPGWTIIGQATLIERRLIHEYEDGKYCLPDDVLKIWRKRRRIMLKLLGRCVSETCAQPDTR